LRLFAGSVVRALRCLLMAGHNPEIIPFEEVTTWRN
jgi:hypothetical protein